MINQIQLDFEAIKKSLKKIIAIKNQEVNIFQYRDNKYGKYKLLNIRKYLQKYEFQLLYIKWDV